MKKLLLIILLTFTALAFADFQINAPKYVVTDENGNDVPNVTRSNSLQKAMEKIQGLPRGIEYGVG